MNILDDVLLKMHPDKGEQLVKRLQADQIAGADPGEVLRMWERLI